MGDGLIRLDSSGTVVFASPNGLSAYHRMGHESDLVGTRLAPLTRSLIRDPFDATEVSHRIIEALDGKPSSRTEADSRRGAVVLFRAVPLRPAGQAAGALVLVDGAQGVPHLPVDVRALGCDFMAFSGHKMCGPTGVGILYGKEKLLEEMPPFLGGGEMIEAVWLDHATWNELPYKFEAGTQPIAETVGLGAAVDYLGRLGMENIAAYERELTAYAEERLDAISGLSLYGHAGQRAGVFSFNVEGMHSHDVAQYLDTEGICVRSGHHCAHPIMRRLGVPSTARASLYFYNTREEVDRLADALGRAKEFFENGI